METTGCRPYRIEYYPNKKQILLFFEHQKETVTEVGASITTPKTIEYKYSVVTGTNENVQIKLVPGRDAFIAEYATEPNVVALSPTLNEIIVSGAKIQLEGPVERIFTSPLGEGWAILFVHDGYLLFSANADPQYREGAPFTFDYRRKIKLKPWEQVLKVKWNTTIPQFPLVAIMTTHRVLIATNTLQIISEINAPNTYPIFYYNSIYWVHLSLLFISEKSIHYLTIGNKQHLLTDIADYNSVISTIWKDRLIYCTWDKTEIKSQIQSIGVLEPILKGSIAFETYRQQQQQQQPPIPLPRVITNEFLQNILSIYDYKRINNNLIDLLNQHKHFDVSLHLALPSPTIDLESKFKQALESKRFQIAQKIVDEQCKTQRSSPPLSGKAHEMATELAKQAIKYGQYQIAFHCYELLQNYFGLFQLSVINRDLQGIYLLKKKLRAHQQSIQFNSPGNSPETQMKLQELNELATACKKITKSKHMTNNNKDHIGIFINLSFNQLLPSYDITPILFNEMSFDISENSLRHITPIGFLDTIEKWQPIIASGDQLSSSITDYYEKDPHLIPFPCAVHGIILLFIIRFKGSSRVIESSEKKLVPSNGQSSAPPKLEAPPLQSNNIERQGFIISGSSILAKIG